MRPPLPVRDLDHVLEHTEGLWEDLRGERVFVTGGTGFFGGWMVETLLHADAKLGLGVKAVLLTRDPDRFRGAAPHVVAHPAVTTHRGNIRDLAIQGGAFSHVLHLATETELAGDPTASFTTAVVGTTRVLELAERCRATRLLCTSSGAVYGTQPPTVERIDERYLGAPRPEDPAAGYGHGKRAAEFLCAAAASQSFEVKIARCFAFVGPLLPLNANFAVGNFLRDALAGGPIHVTGDGTSRRSYLYAADLAVWLWTILLRGASCRPYNVGSEEDLSVAELARLVAATVRPGIDVSVASPSPPANQQPSRYVPSTERAKSELALRPWVSLDDALRRTADWVS